MMTRVACHTSIVGNTQVSFHKYGDFFPGTGALADTGHSGGHNYSVNVPLQEGMDDESYCLVFEPVMQKVHLLRPW